MMRFVLGFFFLIIGILGIILPVIPGVPFLVLSGFLLGIISDRTVVKTLKKFKVKDGKNRLWDRVINYVIIRYIHRKKAVN
ncbi:hypothetical protein PERMA_0691 [Persephonella marina EX-H1]|uniref:Uncharacterized protein n=2 Tax=Hydrogenothermaceae TaxID=224027 RepID=C0QP82_PERMH|nr:hypothetical protein PERMA_0691 [Persephonella marina EX-H1]